ncbi:MAG TPA: TIGR03118 family protein [Pyrinomonadaceae bacterium]|nr:TIGR03118 family protein [Pyrinomonadaceae bacterium]
MKIVFKRFRLLLTVIIAAAILGALTPTRVMPPTHAQQSGGANPEVVPVIPIGQAYRVSTLISDIAGFAPVLDPLLVNPWGITVRGTSPFWVANNGTSTTQLIRGDVGGAPVTLNPSPQTINIPGGLPTGAVGNSTSDFQITPPGGGAPAAANFIFDSITGNILAWNGASGAAAQNVVSSPGNVYTGLAIGATPSGNRIYATDFANNHINVFNGTFAPVLPATFTDLTIPADYAPFNIQNLGGSLYVAYAKVDPMTGRSVDGVGNGYVRKFDTSGVRDLTFTINNGQLNAPWGMVIAPASFGLYGGALLVGNFGAGNPSIHAYNPSNGVLLGTLQDESANGIVIDSLWSLTFGNGGNGGDVNTLYFTAGTGNEEHGLFGKLNPTTSQATSLIQFGSTNYFVDESGGHADVTLIRQGNTSGTASVNFNTFDQSLPGHASQKLDYEISTGKVTFNPGESFKTVRILITDDNYVEGDEVIDMALSNPVGTGLGLGSPNTATVTILDNDTTLPITNPSDNAQFFVRQQYLDFLNREPDTAGFNFWTNEITSCGSDVNCIAVKRVNVSAAFFLSQEFQNTGYLAYLTHRVSFGPSASGSAAPVLYGNFARDTQALQSGYMFGQAGADTVLEANKTAFFNDVVARPEFVAKYPASLTNDQYVDNLLTTANLTATEVRRFEATLTNSQEVPPTVPTLSTGAARPASSGTAVFQFNAAQDAMTFTATISNIDVTGSQTADTNDNLIAAHIHAGASVAPGVNGPVVWGFFGAPFNDNNPNDQVFFPTAGAGAVGGTFRGKWDAPEGNGTTLAAQLTNLRTGHAYINFHTTQFGGGEIRGIFPAADAFRNQLVAALNGSTMTRAQVLRAIAESGEMKAREFNRAFVAMQYFGYLRRDPDTSGFNFWLNKLNSFNGDFMQAEMVKAFITSGEYRLRFGPG